MNGCSFHIVLASFVLVATYLAVADGQVRMLMPAARGSMWRVFTGLGLPVNNDDDLLNCGGYTTQWFLKDGTCGVCGDALGPNQPHVYPGKYATGKLAAWYIKETLIDIQLEVTLFERGYFEFSICHHDSMTSAPTESCFEANDLLMFATSTGSSTKSYVVSTGKHNLKLRLPYGLTCNRCILRFRMRTGSFWGCDGPDDTNCCVGCGKQENFYGCSDIAIINDATQIPGNTPAGQSSCIAAGAWAGDEGMTVWCNLNCPGNCPASHCTC